MNLIVKNLHKSYDKMVLDNVNLEIQDKSIVAIIGPSGGGKSTFLRLLSGIEEPCQGTILVNNMLVEKKR